ncbi:MAG: hypothetical protein LBS24_04750 [Clostridiales Family XIII bacterium]|jgi:hypothetical protein|nr:hypothetical protein [Clostridiales Family XIII bacterium]
MYYNYKERKPRKFNFNGDPPRSAGKRAIHTIILLLFLLAALIFFFPNFFTGPNRADERDSAEPNAENEENAELSSAGVAWADDFCQFAIRLA